MAIQGVWASRDAIPAEYADHVTPVELENGTEEYHLQITGTGAEGDERKWTVEPDVDKLKSSLTAARSERNELKVKTTELNDNITSLNGDIARLKADGPEQAARAQQEVERHKAAADAARQEALGVYAETAVDSAVVRIGGHDLLKHEFTPLVRPRRDEQGRVHLDVLGADGQPRLNDDGSSYTVDQLVEAGRSVPRLAPLYPGHKPSPGDPPPQNQNGGGRQRKYTSEEVAKMDQKEYNEARKQNLI